MAPVISPTTDRLLEALGPAVEPDGEDTDWFLTHLSEALVSPLDELEVLARDTDDGSGWSPIMDVDRSPVDWLGHTGMYVGVRLLPGLDEASQRVRVAGTAGFKRGSLGAVAAAAAQYLTGTRTATIIERDGSAYQLRVITYQVETPDPAATLAALLAQKPAGIILNHDVQAGPSWAQVLPATTWATVSPGTTWADVADMMPGDL